MELSPFYRLVSLIGLTRENRRLDSWSWISVAALAAAAAAAQQTELCVTTSKSQLGVSGPSDTELLQEYESP